MCLFSKSVISNKHRYKWNGISQNRLNNIVCLAFSLIFYLFCLKMGAFSFLQSFFHFQRTLQYLIQNKTFFLYNPAILRFLFLQDNSLIRLLFALAGWLEQKREKGNNFRLYKLSFPIQFLKITEFKNMIHICIYIYTSPLV